MIFLVVIRILFGGMVLFGFFRVLVFDQRLDSAALAIEFLAAFQFQLLLRSLQPFGGDFVDFAIVAGSLFQFVVAGCFFHQAGHPIAVLFRQSK